MVIVYMVETFITTDAFVHQEEVTLEGPNSLRCTKILSQCHHFLFVLPSPFYHLNSHLWMIMMESKIVMV
jgi:hypothetical protein